MISERSRIAMATKRLGHLPLNRRQPRAACLYVLIHRPTSQFYVGVYSDVKYLQAGWRKAMRQPWTMRAYLRRIDSDPSKWELHVLWVHYGEMRPLYALKRAVQARCKAWRPVALINWQ